MATSMRQILVLRPHSARLQAVSTAISLTPRFSEVVVPGQENSNRFSGLEDGVETFQGLLRFSSAGFNAAGETKRHEDPCSSNNCNA